MLCHHGTDHETKKRILRTDFTYSHDGWFGRGIYLFQDNYNLAKEWAIKRHNGKITDVIECEVEFNEDEYVDMTNPENDDTKEFHILRDNELDRILNENDLKVISDDKFELDKIVIRLLVESNIKLFKFSTYTHNIDDGEYNISSRVPNGIEVVINDKKLIKSKV